MHTARNATANRSAVKPTTNDSGWTLADVAYADRWGNYGTAIARHEQVIGRPAPDPTEPGAKGQPRLSARFVEWLMMLPDGWVTAVPGITRNDQLRILGNGVVPPCGAAALRILWQRAFEAVPA
jgi:DNA (cytosine-5)-methyltransferase 1